MSIKIQAITLTAVSMIDVKAPTTLTIDEVNALIDYHQKLYEGIPKDLYDRMTAAGHTLGVTAKNQLKRVKELVELRDTIWPK